MDTRAREYEPASRLLAFIAENGIETLNVAGTRASKKPDIYGLVKGTLEQLFSEGVNVAWRAG